MCLVRPALLYLSVHVLKLFYGQINYYYHFCYLPKLTVNEESDTVIDNCYFSSSTYELLRGFEQ